MSVLCRELVQPINTGRCFALIGAGPSCSVGFPDWKKLAEGAIREKLIETYPHLTKQDINAVLDYASEVISNEDVIDLS